MCQLRLVVAALLASIVVLIPADAEAEDGYALWLRYKPSAAATVSVDRERARALLPQGGSTTIRIAAAELKRGLAGIHGVEPPEVPAPVDGAIVFGTPAGSNDIAALRLPLETLGPEGYLIRRASVRGASVIIIAGNTDIGVLYGAFAFLRHIQTVGGLTDINIASSPRVRLRVLNHWDNLDRTVERGYAGQSIWDWQSLPGETSHIYADYARANASIGINGTVLNNVNASALSLTVPYIEKAAALADVFRPYGIRIYLSARFSAPVELGGLATADPKDEDVQQWWRAKADEIYRAIPDFGGFLVKANSEGQPGPQDYGRSHADGANMLADALAAHGGVVMWRAFVYSQHDADDRAKQAYKEFVGLDGRFRDNVIVQVKNGAIDFQPREPFHPLFGAMPKTPLMMEFQITKEYLGFATHLAYLGPLYEETLQSVTDRPVAGAVVAQVIDGSAYVGRSLTGMAGVANIGSDRNWCGSHFNQANWYVFGRMAWDPQAARAAPIVEEWVKQTFSTDPRIVAPVSDMMMRSREAVVAYMTPLGLHHLMGTDDHYGPAPWVNDLSRPEWNPVYYHRADEDGIGFDRTATGSNALSQYAPSVAARFEDLSTAPENTLLWFHHLSWDYRMASGRTLWDELVLTYGRGVAQVRDMQETWSKLEPLVDADRFRETSRDLAIQEEEAQWWRDASIAYFQSLSKRPLPAGEAPPPHPLAAYMASSGPLTPH